MELRTDREDGVGPSLDETFSSSCCIVCVFGGEAWVGKELVEVRELGLAHKI